MAAPQATSINAIAITPDLRYWLTGGSDGYIRKYDGMATINGKQQLTVAQKHPFVDSVVKAGLLMSYWGNEEPGLPGQRPEDRGLSPVYSLAVHKDALWLLSGCESGAINLQSVRHDAGKRICALRDGGHTNAVSVLQLAPDERSFLSGSWDKTILDWDLNDGHIIRRFEGSGGQISAIELRPSSGAPFPADAGEPELKSDTFDSSNDHKPLSNGFFADSSADAGTSGAANNSNNNKDGAGGAAGGGDAGSGDGDDGDSLFGSPAGSSGSLFGDDNENIGGGNAFGNDDDDNEFSKAMGVEMQQESRDRQVDHSGDFAMGDADAPPAAGSALDSSTIGQQSSTAQANADVNGMSAGSSAPAQDLDMKPTAESQQPPPSSSTTTVQDTQAPPADAQPPSSQPGASSSAPPPPPPSPPSRVFTSGAGNQAGAAGQVDPTQASTSTFLSAAIDGTIRIWDRRVPDPVARINNRRGVPPWCMGACWSPDGNWIYAGRRNGTVEEFSIHKARGGWAPERVLKFPQGSGAVSCVRPMVNGRHLVCASHDILRLYDLRENAAFKHSKVPFIIIPGPPKAGVISSLYIDPTSRIMISAGGTRGWDGTSTEVLIGYQISPTK